MVDNYFVLVDIGCLECGEESALIGVFTECEKAEKALAEARELQRKNWFGQHSFEIFEWDGVCNAYRIPRYGRWVLEGD